MIRFELTPPLSQWEGGREVVRTENVSFKDVAMIISTSWLTGGFLILDSDSITHLWYWNLLGKILRLSVLTLWRRSQNC